MCLDKTECGAGKCFVKLRPETGENVCKAVDYCAMSVLQLGHALTVETMLPSVFSIQCLQRSKHSCI